MLHDGFTALWTLFMAVWMLAAFWSRRTVRRESLKRRMAYGAVLGLGFILLFKPWSLGPLNVRFLPDTLTTALTGLVIAAAGVGFAFWARFTLGRNWSSAVTVKEDHRLIQRGPYRAVRHPIYSGFLLAALGTAIGYGKLPCLIGVAIVFLGFRIKWRMEERFMEEQFGAKYLEYRREVRAIIPGLL